MTTATRHAPLGESETTRLTRAHLHERVAAELRDRIITGAVAPGEKLAVTALAAEIGVSLTPLREALKLLATEGLVDLTPNRGASASRVTVDQTRALFEVIAGTEALAAELACKRMTEPDLAELHALHTQMCAVAGAADVGQYFDLNRRIHDRIVDFARNPILSDQRDRLAQQAERVRFIALNKEARREAALQEHLDLMAAFNARDADRARRIWRGHLMASGQQTIDYLVRRAAPDARTNQT
ncbi:MULTISPECIES: GntR family transcriptional regulator [unclassified Marinovum]